MPAFKIDLKNNLQRKVHYSVDDFLNPERRSFDDYGETTLLEGELNKVSKYRVLQCKTSGIP